ncbi:MAG: phasin family protein [Hyphomicrobiales bacterium]
MMKSFEDFQTYGKEGMDAYVASAAAVTKGFQTMTAEAVEYARRTFEKGSEAFEQAAAAKSFDKALEVQQGYAKDTYESLFSQLNKFGELYLATAKEAYRPFEAKFSSFAPKVAK